MIKSKFKTVVKEHIKKVSLSEQQLNELQQLISTTQEKTVESTRKETSKYQWINYAMVASLGILFGVFLNQQLGIIPTETNFIQTMAIEVARNHHQVIPMEVKSDSMKQVSEYFNELSFKPIKTSQLDFEKIKISGGRYCSLNGVTAAQIRLKRSGNPNIQTLYETEYRADFYRSLPNVDKGENPLQLHIEGLDMTAWIENGLVFTMTDVK